MALWREGERQCLPFLAPAHSPLTHICSWITSMGGIFAYIHAQPMSFSQKLVQTRVWAQGLTLASLLGMAAITQIPSAGDHILREREQAADHSWKDFVGEGNAETVSHGIAAHSAKHC